VKEIVLPTFFILCEQVHREAEEEKRRMDEKSGKRTLIRRK